MPESDDKGEIQTNSIQFNIHNTRTNLYNFFCGLLKLAQVDLHLAEANWSDNCVQI